MTAQMLIANWKYYTYKIATNRLSAAEAWLTNAWPIERAGADYLVRMHDTPPAGTIHLLPGNSSPAEYTAWIHFAANAVPALRSASVRLRRSIRS